MATIIIIGLGLVQMTVLARLIDNHEFGLLTVSLVIIAPARYAVGLWYRQLSYPAQRNQPSGTDHALLANVGLGILVFVLVFLPGDVIAGVCNPDLAPLMRTLSFAFVLIPHGQQFRR
ncbi:oligosaccharide flippase family protein [Shigella flexneri]